MEAVYSSARVLAKPNGLNIEVPSIKRFNSNMPRIDSEISPRIDFKFDASVKDGGFNTPQDRLACLRFETSSLWLRASIVASRASIRDQKRSTRE